MNTENPKTKILIAEDDEMLIEVYKKKFENSGLDLFFANNGKEVIESAQKNLPDLILLDLVMPEMDGFEVLGKMKNDNLTKDIKIVITSNLSQKNEQDRAMELGATDFLIKSGYSLNELADKIKSYL